MSTVKLVCEIATESDATVEKRSRQAKNNDSAAVLQEVEVNSQLDNVMV
jgi:hypothetical protein